MARKTHHSPTNHTILVVDDQQEVLLSVSSLLEREGHRVVTADSGERALVLFKEHDVHLLLVDYFMPRMSGEELIRRIRTFDPYVQIILQTGYSGEKPASQMMAELDIQGYHDKSDGPDKLLLWVDVGLKAHGLIARLRERERLQGELVANVSHEFRTPLNIIGGYTELLLDGHFGHLPAAAKKPLAALQHATQNLAELVSDFLSYAKVEAGVIKVSRQQLALRDLANELERFAGLLLEDKQVNFAVDLDRAPAEVVTDPVKLRTILRNLITNAIKFTSAGQISLRITAEEDVVRFAVQDSGVGIAREDLDRIFEPFRQLDGSSTRQHPGIGLGLALSRKLARILSGDLEVDSEVGVGSTFVLTLPTRGEDTGRVEPSLRDVDKADSAVASAADAA